MDNTGQRLTPVNLCPSKFDITSRMFPTFPQKHIAHVHHVNNNDDIQEQGCFNAALENLKICEVSDIKKRSKMTLNRLTIYKQTAFHFEQRLMRMCAMYDHTTNEDTKVMVYKFQQNAKSMYIDDE